MANPNKLFGFEQSVVRVNDGTMFRPMKDAIDRWVCQSPAPYAVLGEDFQILYELPSNRFVIVYYSCCRKTAAEFDGERLEFWTSDAGYEARAMSATTAVRMLIKAEFEVPERLDPILAKIEEEDSVIIAELAPRPISHWASGDYVGQQSRTKAHTVDAIASAREIVDFGIRAIQQLRHDGPPVPNSLDPLRIVELRLFATYPVDHEYWWGTKDRIPPATVGITDLSWPTDSAAAHGVIHAIQNLLLAPLSVMNAARGASTSREHPTE